MKPKTEKKCRFCGKLFRPYLSTDKYCSIDCAIAGGLYKRAKNRQYYGKYKREPNKRLKAKAEAKVRDRANCMMKKYVSHDRHNVGREEHHIIYLSEDGPDEVWNLITLCTHCHHEIVHKKKGTWQHRLLIILHGVDWFEKIPKEGLPETVIKKLTYLNSKKW